MVFFLYVLFAFLQVERFRNNILFCSGLSLHFVESVFQKNRVLRF